MTASNSLVQFPDPNIVLAGAGNQVGVDPLLGPLAFNGGTDPHAGVAARQPGDRRGQQPAGSRPTDQRGLAFPRVVSAIADIGAFEYNPVSTGSTFSRDYVQKAYVSYYGRAGRPGGGRLLGAAHGRGGRFPCRPSSRRSAIRTNSIAAMAGWALQRW